ncbi:SWIM zinc finger family protein, partial [Streptomyces sp. MB09-02B]
MNAELPPVAPDVVAAAVESLTSRLLKKLDAAVETYAALPVAVDGGALRVRCGEDAEVTLTPGPSGAVTDTDGAVCSCLLAPRCLHRAAVLSACPVADAEHMAAAEPETGPSGAAADLHGSEGGAPSTGGHRAAGGDSSSTVGATVGAAASLEADGSSAAAAAAEDPSASRDAAAPTV